MSRVDPLNADALRTALGAQLVGNFILVLEETTSTNDVVGKMAADHAEGLAVIAERQTAGRGQYGRRWESAPGKGLWLSLLLRPKIAVEQSSLITDFLARAIAATVTEEIGVTATIKPPNDVYIDVHKIAGVLVEMRVEPGGSYCAIAGLGVNVNHEPNDFPSELRATAGSLAMATGRPCDRTAFAVALLRKLDQDYSALSA